jgi:hypothetical protein
MKIEMMFLVAVALVGCAHEERSTSLTLDDGTASSACCGSVEWGNDSIEVWVGDENVTLSFEAKGWTSFTTGKDAHVDLAVASQVFSTTNGGSCAVTIDPSEGDGATSGSFTCTQMADAKGNVRDASGTFVVGKDATTTPNDPRAPFIIGGIIGGGGPSW